MNFYDTVGAEPAAVVNSNVGLLIVQLVVLHCKKQGVEAPVLHHVHYDLVPGGSLKERRNQFVDDALELVHLFHLLVLPPRDEQERMAAAAQVQLLPARLLSPHEYPTILSLQHCPYVVAIRRQNLNALLLNYLALAQRAMELVLQNLVMSRHKQVVLLL